MRVAINAQFLQEPHTGTGRYLYNLMSALGRVDGVNEYLALTPRPLAPDAVPETPSTFQWEVAASRLQRGGASIEKVAWEQRTFPRAAKAANARLMHIPHFAPPLRTYGIPVVVTIHDVINLRLPLYRARATSQVYASLVARAARGATAIIAVSEYSKRDIIELIGVPAERVVVIGEAPAPTYRRVTDAAQLRAVRAKYGLSERYILSTGLDARKNISTLIGAFAAVYHELNEPGLQLFIIGDPRRLGTGPLYPDWRPLAETFDIGGQVHCASVDEADMAAVYSACACFAFTSLYEGFGLTPLEAMACGAPIVCSDRTSLPEVVGSAGLLVDPDDPDRVGAALYRVLSSREQSDDLRARSLAHVKQFSWDKVAATTSSLYTDVTGSGRD
ncbi:MAG TPA: glycosyltransferase family 1 protein [Ktedonobacterales bacterium]|nr:glycosyltransferase family 1 protein [Ktedonobacterales bacterium]